MSKVLFVLICIGCISCKSPGIAQEKDVKKEKPATTVKKPQYMGEEEAINPGTLLFTAELISLSENKKANACAQKNTTVAVVRVITLIGAGAGVTRVVNPGEEIALGVSAAFYKTNKGDTSRNKLKIQVLEEICFTNNQPGYKVLRIE
ncbi:hypothetical protein HN014_07490 [Aquimarina sp. TRL1]|uniref:hypothetical protein n=1 Tax=Aquimarina sp. (strain TRL1) TaxID=2736252 RepID=UPI00158980E9|nr:hypothetical protein [Aquimarina sp. TRL1]QKX04762.1 hypothetical protein HN014_07490 [Aquimarina sp. TRL1]